MESEVKLLIFCHECPPLGAGTGNALYYLSREWVEAGHSVTVVTSAYQDLPLLEMVDGVKIIRLKVGRQHVFQSSLSQILRFMIQSSFHVKKFFDEEKPDLCVGFMTIPGGMAPYLMKRNHGVPYVTQIRGGDVPGFGASFLKVLHGIFKPLIGKIWKDSAYVIANSQGLAELAGQNTSGIKITSIPNGVDSAFFVPIEKKIEATLKLLFVGRFVNSQKNIPILLKALSGLDHVRLGLVGEGPDKGFLMKQAKKMDVLSKIDFHSWLKKEELLKIYQSADIYVSASLWEGMPNAALEAMACGLPLVLSRVFGHENLVQQGTNGFLFESARIDDLIQRIIQLRDNPSLRLLMGQRSRKKAVEEYNWKKIANQHLQYFG